jgi:FkbM family methyltransferase
LSKIKSFLIQLLGRENYLRLASKSFFIAFRAGLLKRHPWYQTHYFIHHFIGPGDTVADLGANLGYYTRLFARLVGRQGRVLAVEPIPMYRRILMKNTARFPQVTILPYALGLHEGSLRLGLPAGEKYRHGLMRVLNEEERATAIEISEVEQKNPAALFHDLTRLDYLKCDIEGYEVPVIPAMEPIILRHKPIVQVETDGENKRILFRLFNSWGYKMYYIGKKGLVCYTDPEMILPADLIAIPLQRIPSVEKLLPKS